MFVQPFRFHRRTRAIDQRVMAQADALDLTRCTRGEKYESSVGPGTFCRAIAIGCFSFFQKAGITYQFGLLVVSHTPVLVEDNRAD